MPKKFPWKYVIEDNTDDVPRIYFRRRGFPKVRLMETPGSPEFMLEYNRALRGEVPEKAGPRRAKPNTLWWLCEEYFKSPEFLKLEKHHVRRQILETCLAEAIRPDSARVYADMPLPSFNAKAVRTLRDRKAEFPEAGNGRVKALRAMFNWALEPGVEKAITNPARDVPYLSSDNPEGFHTWTYTECEQFKARHPVGTKARLAFGLLYYMAQRRSDAVIFGKQHLAKTPARWSLRFTQFKGRKKTAVTLVLDVPVELREILEKTPLGDLTFLVTEFGKPFTSNGFGNKMREWCDQAELWHCTSHGLRKARSAHMADKGATAHQIKAVTGHRTLKEVTRYTESADQRRLASSAVALMEQPDEDEE